MTYEIEAKALIPMVRKFPVRTPFGDIVSAIEIEDNRVEVTYNNGDKVAMQQNREIMVYDY